MRRRCKYCSKLEQHLVNCSAPGWSTTVCRGLRYLLNCAAPRWSSTLLTVVLQGGALQLTRYLSLLHTVEAYINVVTTNIICFSICT